MAEKRVLKFNHSNVVTEKKKKKKPEKIDEGFNEMTKELRNRLITKNKEMMKQQPTVKHSMTSEINNFDNAIKFLERIREKKKKKEKRKHKTTVKCHTKDFPKNENSLLKSDPPCGVLKNGKKPLWRDYHKTRKKKLNIQNDASENTEVLNTQKSIDISKPVVVIEEPKSAVVIEEPKPLVIEQPKPVVVIEEPKPVVIEEPKPVDIEKPKQELSGNSNPKIVLGKVKSKLHFLLKTRKRKKKSNRYTQKHRLNKIGLIKKNSSTPDDIIQIMYDSIVNEHDEELCNIKDNKDLDN